MVLNVARNLSQDIVHCCERTEADAMRSDGESRAITMSVTKFRVVSNVVAYSGSPGLK